MLVPGDTHSLFQEAGDVFAIGTSGLEEQIGFLSQVGRFRNVVLLLDIGFILFIVVVVVVVVVVVAAVVLVIVASSEYLYIVVVVVLSVYL